MATLNPASLPSSINTVERCLVWCTMVLQNMAPNLTAIEVAGQNTRIITAAPFYIIDSDPQTWRHIARASIPLASGWQRGAARYHTFAQEVITGSVPTEFMAA